MEENVIMNNEMANNVAVENAVEEVVATNGSLGAVKVVIGLGAVGFGVYLLIKKVIKPGIEKAKAKRKARVKTISEDCEFPEDVKTVLDDEQETRD